MFFKQFYLGCLAHASYLIGSNGEAAVVDPQRDVDQYIEEAARHGFAIRYVLETHLHADFVSGHRELAERTGAEIVFGARSDAEFEHRGVRDGDELVLGGIRLRALETPGHTPESVSWLVIDEEGRAGKVLTGDTLFIGDVGRPDLVGAKGFTADQMAGMLYDSVHTKLLTLDDAVEVYPAHGAGSACGRNISKERSSTIGEQRRFNWALKPMPRDEFVRLMTTDLPRAPKYFPLDAEMNRRGAGPVSAIAVEPLPPAEFARHMDRGALVVDVRNSGSFGAGHIPGSINIGLDGQYASWAGSLLAHDAPLLVVSDSVEQAREAVLRLARVGLERVAGYLDGGLATWSGDGRAITQLPQLPVDELHARLQESARLHVIDVRTPGEFASGHVPGALNAPLADINDSLPRVSSDEPIAIICAGGYRSSAASSVLARHGFRDLYNVIGGTSAWVKAGFATEQ